MEALRTPERLLVVEQQGDAPAGVLGEWAAARGIELDVVRPRSGEELPAPARLRAVAVLGSDASVHATREPWVAREVDWLRDVVAAGVPVLGLCFGAQALAAAMGGGVARLPRPEIGWIRVDGAAGAVSAGPWFAWHEDGFTVPPGARPLGHSPAGPQAFAAGPHLALQFHPEVTPAIVDGWVESGGRQLADEALDPGALRAETGRWAPAAWTAAHELFDAWLAMNSPGHLSAA